jgi:hypothetical protein
MATDSAPPSHPIVNNSPLRSWTSFLWGLFRSANEAAKLGDDCTNKVFVVTGAYSGIGV